MRPYKNTWHLYTLPFLMVVFTYSSSVQSAVDEFNLFEPQRGKVQQKPASSLKLNKKPRVKPNRSIKGKQNHFLLRGTSRLGRSYSAVLQPPGPKKKKDIRQQWTPGRASSIDGFSGYKLISVQPRAVVIEYPATELCRISYPEKGVECSTDGRRATLTLARRTPTRSVKPVSPGTKGKGGLKKGEKENPFLAALNKAKAKKEAEEKTEDQKTQEARIREELRQKRIERFKNFKKKVIKDEDVPPGMKVIHTPFGDRLVPVK